MSAMVGMVFNVSAFGNEYSETMAPPTNIFFDDEISKTSGGIDDNTIAGQFVGTINATGGDGPFTFSLVAGEGDADNALFELRTDSLFTAGYIDYETHPEAFSIRVQAANGTEADTYVQAITITSVDLPEANFGSRGNELLVNTPNSNAQTNSAVARDADGNYVVVWQDRTFAIYGQRYDAQANPIGDNIRVNDLNIGAELPDIAMADDGSFVVVWQGESQDGDSTAVVGKMYSSEAVAGAEFVINDIIAGYQGNPKVSMNASGAFVVVWDGYGEADDLGIYARTYASDGTASGLQFPVNTTVAGEQSDPGVAIDDSGNFKVVWSSQNQVNGASLGDIYFRSFTPELTSGAETLVNATTPNEQSVPDIAMSGDGAFVIAWQSDLQDGGASGVYLQAYDNAGAASGTETLVNSEQTAGNQVTPSVSINDNGDFAVAYTGRNESSPTNTNQEIRVRRFPAGVAEAGFEVNKIRAGQQRFPDIAVNGNGSFVISWEGSNAGAGDYDIYTQRFYNNSAPTDVTLDNLNIANGSIAGAPVGTFSTTDADAGDKFGYVLVTGDGSDDNASFTIQGNQLLLAATADLAAKASYSIRVQTLDALGASFEKAFTISVVEGGAAPVVATNNGITVAQGDTATISQDVLAVTDADNTAEELTYSVVTLPANGTIMKEDIALEANGTFTQADIDNSIIMYVHNNSATTADSFGFTVNDGQGGSVAETTFAITITAASGNPTANAGADQTVTDEDGDGTADVVLDGSASTDDGTIASYAWIENDTDTLAVVVNPTVSLAVGIHTIALVVTDSGGLMASDTVVVTVNAAGAENTAPVVATNAGLSLAQGDTVAISSEQLQVTDAESASTAITYTLTQVPAQGSLQRDGVDLAVAGTFTQQDINDGLIRYANNNASVASDAFSFTAADENGSATAETQFAITISVSVVTAIGDAIDSKLVTVYPNPSQQTLYIKMDKQTRGDVGVKVSNSMGQLLKSVQLDAQKLAQYPIDISNLSKGTYFVRIEADNQTIIKKLIKE